MKDMKWEKNFSFKETFSLVPRSWNIKIILVLVSYYIWFINYFDIVIAYLKLNINMFSYIKLLDRYKIRYRYCTKKKLFMAWYNQFIC